MISNEWKVAGTFVKGLSHEKQNIDCHDRFAYKCEDDAICMGLADGAGSVRYPEIGAEIATNQVNRTLIKHFDWLYKVTTEMARDKIAHVIRARIGIYANKKQTSLNDFAATLLFVCIKENKFIAGHIGDGILAYLEDNELKILSPPENGEFINETYFITSKSYKTRLRIFKGEINNIKGFVLMTDGTCEGLFDKKNRKIAPVVLTLLDWLDNFPIKEVNNALKENFENLIHKKTSDDCSIGLMKRINID